MIEIEIARQFPIDALVALSQQLCTTFGDLYQGASGRDGLTVRLLDRATDAQQAQVKRIVETFDLDTRTPEQRLHKALTAYVEQGRKLYTADMLEDERITPDILKGMVRYLFAEITLLRQQ